MKNRSLYILYTILASFLTGMVLSFPLWLNTAKIPTTPIFLWLEKISMIGPIPLASIFSALLIFCLLSCFFITKKQLALRISFVLLFLLFIFDQGRLQPWAYMYTIMIGLLSCIPWQEKETSQEASIIHALRIIVIGTYLWSGLHKLTLHFSTDLLPWLLSPLQLFNITLHGPTFFWLGSFIAATEIGIAIGLSIPRWRKHAVYLAITVHAVALLLLMTMQWNSVVWPWNIAMTLLVIFLFKDDATSLKKIFSITIFSSISVLLFLVLPFFSTLGYWDDYLSSNLYSGNTHSAIIEISNQKISYLDWAMDTTNTPGYPAERVIINVFKQACKNTQESEGTLTIITKDTLLKNSKKTVFSCKDF